MADPIATDDPSLPRRMADFDTLAEALDYAAKGQRGFNFYSLRGDLEACITFSELREGALAHARRLIAAGLDRGDRVALVADTSPEFLGAFFGCQYAGLLPVPLPLPTSFGGRDGYVDQLRKQMQSCAASAAVAPDMMRDLLLQAGQGLDLKLICSDRELDSLSLSKSDPVPSGRNEICYLQYSSGSTRFPHGVTVTQSAAMANCRSNAQNGVSIQDGDRGMSWLPFYHDMGLVGFMLTLLATQVTTDYLPTEYFARRPLMWMELMSRHGGTLAFSPSFGYELCQRRSTEERVAGLDLSAWRVAGIGADMIRADVMQSFADTFAPAGFRKEAFMPSYGLAEATLAVSFMPPGRGIETDVVDEDRLSGENRAVQVDPERFERPDSVRHVVNCGRPLPDCAIEIRNENGDDLPDRHVGKVFVKGPSIMTGYYNDPEATSAVLDGDGWLDTGDMGYRLDGYLYIVGRAKDIIILNGRNHWPQDIEWSVEQIESLRSGDSAAISVPGKAGEEVATVLVQCRLSDLEERKALVSEVKKRVQASTGISCRVALVKPRSLPRTSSGKLSRAKARQFYISGKLEALDGSDPQPWESSSSTVRTAAAG